MKFNRKELRDAVQRAIDEQYNNHFRVEAEYQRGLDHNRQEWFMNYHQKWLDALEAAQKKLRTGEPVTEDDFPRVSDYGSRHAFFRDESITKRNQRIPRPPTQPQISPELISLREVLDVCEDDYVTTSGLSDMGFGSLRHVVKHLGNKEKQA